jgi:hypothetical protein
VGHLGHAGTSSRGLRLFDTGPGQTVGTPSSTRRRPATSQNFQPGFTYGNPRQATLSQLPMLAAMILFSLQSLWLLAQPMVMRTAM